MPTIRGLGGGRYFWPIYPASNKITTLAPVIKRFLESLYVKLIIIDFIVLFQ